MALTFNPLLKTCTMLSRSSLALEQAPRTLYRRIAVFHLYLRPLCLPMVHKGFSGKTPAWTHGLRMTRVHKWCPRVFQKLNRGAHDCVIPDTSFSVLPQSAYPLATALLTGISDRTPTSNLPTWDGGSIIPVSKRSEVWRDPPWKDVCGHSRWIQAALFCKCHAAEQPTLVYFISRGHCFKQGILDDEV